MSSSPSTASSTSESLMVAVADHMRQSVQQQQELLVNIEKCLCGIEELRACAMKRECSGSFPLSCAEKRGDGTIVAGIEMTDAIEKKMCDYCFKITRCRPCPDCQREWYCSSSCQRLRVYLHRTVCHHQKGDS